MDNIEYIHKLLSNFNRIELGAFPTPLHRLKRYESLTGYDGIWIKRDDMTGLAMGGNKSRNLQYIIGDALSKKADTIIVTGPVQSNLCCLAAAAAAKIGMECISIHNGYEPKDIRGNTLLNSILGVTSYYIGKVDEKTRQDYAVSIAADLQKKRKKPYIIYNGGSTALGALGYVEAALEFYKQCKSQAISVKQVFIP